MASNSQQGRPDDNPEFMENKPVKGGSQYESTRPYSNSSVDDPPGESPSAGAPATATSDGDIGLDEKYIDAKGQATDTWLIERAQEIYNTSTDYLDSNITTIWETSLSHFNNEHAPASRFRRANFKRSNVFRPKTRANIKNQEANLAAAAFSTQDLVDIQPQDKTNEKQILSAKINKSLLQHRLSTQMPWFLTVQGAYQDTKNYGICVTHQYWSYKEDKDILPALDENGALIMDKDDDGNDVPMGYEETTVREDTLRCDNVAPENFRFDPMCDWRDPATSSPYIVYMMPIYANEALEMMEMLDPKTGRKAWRKYSLSQVLSTRRQDYDRTRQAREGRDRIDPADEQHGNGYTTVWAHMNIIKVNGDDVMYFTMGTELLLTDPVKLVDAFPHLRPGQRPFTVGFSNIETHKNYPAGDNELAHGLQFEINEVANQRLDNVKLALNKRYYVKRGSQVDLDALIRNVPGGGVMMNDIDKDVKTVETRDVTGSSYREQDKLSVEMDEILGGFSQSSAQDVGKNSGAVGAMSMASQSAGSVQDYTIRLFMETWMEPTLRQMVQLIQMYETDETLMALAAKDAGVWERYGLDIITDDMLQQNLTTNVNIGIGNTDPVRRVEKLVFGVAKSAELPGMVDRMKSSKISDEIFGAMGYKDSSRFFMSDEEWEQQQANAEPPGPPPEIQVKLEELRIREEDNKARHEREMQRLAMDQDVEFGRMALEKELKLEDIYAKLGVERLKDQTARDTAALRESNKIQELNMKRATGSGI